MLVWISGANAGLPVPIPYVDAQGNQYPPNMEQAWTSAQLAAIGIKSIPDPVLAPSVTFLQFMALFTPAEQLAIAASNDPQVKLFVMMATGQPHIEMDNASVVSGVNYLASSGVIQQARVATILAASPPD